MTNRNDLEFTQAEIAIILASHFGVSFKDQSKFVGRMRNFLRLGWPAVVSTKGKAAKFAFADCFDFALAMELTNVGFSPGRCIEIINYTRRNRESGEHYKSMPILIPAALGSSSKSYELEIDMDPHIRVFSALTECAA